MLLDAGAHPVDLGVPGDGGVVDVDHDHLAQGLFRKTFLTM